jgi:hypothetical protein
MDLSMKTMLAACFLIGLTVTAANAIDLAELAPCKPAAARMCATLAAHSWRISSDCRAVLHKYGQL